MSNKEKKLSKAERCLFYWLDTNCRMSNKKIAKKCRLSDFVVKYKIDHLVKEGTIKFFQTAINTAALGYSTYKILLRYYGMDKKTEKEFLDFLIQNERIHWLTTMEGRWDLVIDVFAKNLDDLDAIIKNMFEKYEKYIHNRVVIGFVRSYHFPRNYLVNKDFDDKYWIAQGSEKREKISMDELDHKLLKALSMNARASYYDLAKILKTSPATVRNRMRTLERKNILIYYRPLLNLKTYGFSVYKILLSMRKISHSLEKQLFNFVSTFGGILYLNRTIGLWDFEIELETADKRRLTELMKGIKTKFSDELKDIELVEYGKEIKYDFYPFKI